MTNRLVDMTGRRYGRLVVLRRAARKSNELKQALWDCLCDCGTAQMVIGKNLRSGNTKSCGCFRRESSQDRMFDMKKYKRRKRR